MTYNHSPERAFFGMQKRNILSLLLLFTPICISNSFAQSATKPAVKQEVKKASPAPTKVTPTPKPSPKVTPKPSTSPKPKETASSIDINEIYTPNSSKTIKKVETKPSANPVSVSSSQPTVTADILTSPSPTSSPTVKPEDRIADDIDVSTYSYINNLEASTEFFNLIINSTCSKAPENCNSTDKLAKTAKQITDEIKKKYPTSSNIISESQTRYFLMNSVTLKDKLGKDNLLKISAIKDQLKLINDSVFNEKKDDIIKKIAANPVLPSASPTVTALNPSSNDPLALPQENTEPKDTGKIAFVSERDGNPEIYTMNPDGKNQTRITNNDVYDQMPSWSHDGSKLAFVSERDGNPEIYTMNPDGSNPVRLTNNSAYDYSPSWSPDGTKIVFVSNRENIQNANSPVARLGFKIFIMNSDGTEQRQLFENSVGDDSPAWSPDGTRIAFVSKRDGNPEIYSCNIDGTNVIRLTNSPTFDMMPSWSPDGTKLAFRSDRDGNPEIYTMNYDGSNQVRVTRNLSSDEYPTWSSDGTKILFVSRRDNIKDESGNFVNEIYIMNSDSSNINRLTKNSADDYQPSWSKNP